MEPAVFTVLFRNCSTSRQRFAFITCILRAARSDQRVELPSWIFLFASLQKLSFVDTDPGPVTDGFLERCVGNALRHLQLDEGLQKEAYRVTEDSIFAFIFHKDEEDVTLSLSYAHVTDAFSRKLVQVSPVRKQGGSVTHHIKRKW